MKIGSLIATGLLFAVGLYATNNADDAEKKIFMDKISSKIDEQKKGMSCKIPSVSAEQVFKDVNVSDAVKANASAILDSQKKDQKLAKQAEEDSAFVNTKVFEKKFNDAKQNILFDKKLGWGEQAKIAQKIIDENGNDADTNFYFNSKETVYVFISSSMPRETLINYIESVRYQQDNFVFVLRGGIGGIKKMKPTLLWIKDLIGEKYASTRIIIDPRLSKRFNIQQVPAVAYTEKTMFELQTEEALRAKDEPDADTYIAYGDMPIKYALKQLNEKKKNDFLVNLIRKMETR